MTKEQIKYLRKNLGKEANMFITVNIEEFKNSLFISNLLLHKLIKSKKKGEIC